MRSGPDSWAPVAICALAFVLPLEPPNWTLHALGLELTLLELAAGLAFLTATACLAAGDRLARLLHVPLLGWALAFLAACALSTAFAEPPRVLPLKFTLRMAAGIAAFALTSLTLSSSSRVSGVLGTFGLAGASVAIFGLAEAAGVPGTSALAALFRDQDFEVGGSLRIASTFSYPNTAAGFLVLATPGALLAVFSESSSRFIRWAAALATLLMLMAILLTYSRGALLGALFVPLPFVLWGLWQRKTVIVARALACFAVFFVLAATVTFAKESFRLRIVSEADASWYRAEFSSPVDKLFLEPGELSRAPVSVRNAGRMAWEVEGEKRFHLSYRWFDLTTRELIDLVAIEGERTSLPRRVEPGETVQLLAYVRAPHSEGNYLLVWDMVQEHTTWFTEKGGGGESLNVQVGPVRAAAVKTVDDVVSGLTQASWRPGRLELWALAIQLFSENPLLGAGPDNFRWLYGRAAGRETWDTRTFANSLYLEILATTGLVGAAAFFGFLVAAAVRLFRLTRKVGSPLVSATLGASLGGFLVHGFFDYLLESTSIYLGFWIVLGATSSLVAREQEVSC